MKALILAAGRGSRMRPFSDHVAKPLLRVKGRPLIEYHIEALARIGIKDIVINTSHLAWQFPKLLGDGSRFGVNLHFLYEETPLEVGGGIVNALELLADEPFIVVSGDVWTDFPFETLPKALDDHLAHLVLVNNPPYHPDGDFCLTDEKIQYEGAPKFNYGNIGVFHPDFFKGCEPGSLPLRPLLEKHIGAKQISGEHYPGTWYNVGSPDILQHLNERGA